MDDSEFTKEEIKAFEKKDWIGIKDLIFDTEPRILDHLSSHCARWRQSKMNKLLDIAKVVT